jgi:hypothetical protein
VICDFDLGLVHRILTNGSPMVLLWEVSEATGQRFIADATKPFERLPTP